MSDVGVTVSALHPGWAKTDMGGEDADITPEEAGEKIYCFAQSRPETGLFWFNGESLPW
jgi:NAD(P)-dependent dehydrogenase (short-subunit alcohol dehydrogenase family)